MKHRPGNGPRFVLAIATILSLTSARGHAAETPDGHVGIGIETGTLRFSRNDARIPGDTGTEFDVTALTGTDTGAFVRLDAHWRIDVRHSLRLVLAPLEASDTGRLARDTDFAGETFVAGEAEGTYRFNAYKLTYRYTVSDLGRLRWGVGFTGVVRDAKIELRQDGTRALDDNVGFVPALHLSGEYRFGERWALAVDFDGLAGGPGRLIDIAAKLHYRVGGHWFVGGGYRILEGGADTDSVYNFARIDYALLDLRYHLF